MDERHLISYRVSSVLFDSLHDEVRLSFVEEGILVGEIDDEEEAQNGTENGESSEENEDPLPTGDSTLSVEERHSV